ncbi:hypothetical protein AK812_SmicGene28874 [Symbiodinium microadriaticum]|uniref:Uncharacterized protein n=1 Tax=Symbiodinium microadriaticum TaxID=2951 RepID=A0A1Q9D364_SYMMI|nr:hypothetical protein AK812_SmicGene28874 [Symbiodinium microadriaticum]
MPPEALERMQQSSSNFLEGVMASMPGSEITPESLAKAQLDVPFIAWTAVEGLKLSGDVQPEEEPRKLQGTDDEELQVSQQCSWGSPSISGYAFESTQCGQTGSLVYRLSMLYIYFAGCIYAVFTILGQIIRVMLNPEPWFFNPQTPDESIIFRLLRKVAP